MARGVERPATLLELSRRADGSGQNHNAIVELASGRRYMSYVFNVEGMHCANCALGVERVVRALQGVQRVSVNATTARASVEWDSNTISLSRILDAIRKAGFKPVPFEGEAA